MVALAAFLGWRAMNDHTLPSRKPENVTARRVRTVPITFFSGTMGDPAFSPDGKQIAFVWDGKDHSQLNIYTLPIGGDQTYQVTHFGIAPLTEGPPALSWSPDGQFLAYAQCSNHEAGVFVVPALGGPERKLTSVVCFAAFDGPPQWTPDGRAMVIADECGTKAPFAIALVRLSLPSGRKDCLTTPPMHTFDMQFKLSPDGKKVAFVRAPTPQVGDYYVVPITGGTPLRLTRGEIQFGPLMWSPDSRRIIFYSGHQEVQGDRTVQIPAEGGEIVPELVYTTIGALSPDGQRVAYSDDSESEPRSIWRVRLSAPGGRVISNQKIIDSGLFDSSPQLSPDGTRIAFVSIRSGHVQIWTSDSEGNGAVQLTSFGGEPAGSARWSPDGKLIVFDRRPGTRSQLWLMDSDGRDLHSLVSSAADSEVPSWSRDGKSIYFASRSRSGDFQLWKQRLTSDRLHPDGEPVQVTKGAGFSGFESYDGKTIYYTRSGERGIWSIPTMGGLETRVTSDPPRGLWGHWAVSESGLYVLACKASSHCKLEFYRFGTRKVTPVIDVEHDLGDGDPGVSCSRDGRTVLYTRVDPVESHIAMTELLK